jgi:hypothetical protein
VQRRAQGVVVAAREEERRKCEAGNEERTSHGSCVLRPWEQRRGNGGNLGGRMLPAEAWDSRSHPTMPHESSGRRCWRERGALGIGRANPGTWDGEEAHRCVKRDAFWRARQLSVVARTHRTARRARCHASVAESRGAQHFAAPSVCTKSTALPHVDAPRSSTRAVTAPSRVARMTLQRWSTAALSSCDSSAGDSTPRSTLAPPLLLCGSSGSETDAD